MAGRCSLPLEVDARLSLETEWMRVLSVAVHVLHPRCGLVASSCPWLLPLPRKGI
jgi:hypothetical protein